MAGKPSRWMGVFQDFVKDIRISSKEVVSDDPRGSPLKLWESQKRFVKTVGEGLDKGVRQFSCLKSRQLGITTVSLALDTMWLAMHNNLIGALVTDTEKNRDVNRNMIERYVEGFPEGYFGDDEFYIKQANSKFILFSNGSRLDLLIAGTKKKSVAWAEGVGYAYIHATEIGKYGNAEGYASLEESFAQANPNRLLIRESTGNGFNHWRNLYLQGKEDLTQIAFFIGWWAAENNVIQQNDPRFPIFGSYPASGEEREKIAAVRRMYGWEITPEQLAWIRWKQSKSTADTEQIDAQNQPWTEEEAFVLSGFSFFQTRQITKDMLALEEADVAYQAYYYELDTTFFEMKLVQVVDEEDRDRIELKVWEEPVEGGKYVIGCDPAWGRNEWSDRSCVSVWRCYADKLVQVAEFATADIEVKHCAWVLAHLAGAYSDCIVNIDLVGPGKVIMMEWDHIVALMNAEYMADRVKDKDWENALSQARWYLYHRPDAMGAGYAMNFQSTGQLKEELMHGMRGAYVTREIVIRSMLLLAEMQNVINDGGTIGAPESADENSKDDRVFGAALAIRTWVNWTRKEMMALGLTYERVTQEETGESTLAARQMNRIVFNFFQGAEQRSMELDPRPAWMVDRGLA